MNKEEYIWLDKTENGRKNPRAIQRKRLSDNDYLLKLEMADNSKKLSMLDSSIGVNKENL